MKIYYKTIPKLLQNYSKTTPCPRNDSKTTPKLLQNYSVSEKLFWNYSKTTPCQTLKLWLISNYSKTTQCLGCGLRVFLGYSKTTPCQTVIPATTPPFLGTCSYSGGLGEEWSWVWSVCTELHDSSERPQIGWVRINWDHLALGSAEII